MYEVEIRAGADVDVEPAVYEGVGQPVEVRKLVPPGAAEHACTQVVNRHADNRDNSGTTSEVVARWYTLVRSSSVLTADE